MLYYAQRRVLRPKMREALTSVINIPRPKLAATEDLREKINQLKTDGILFLPGLISPQDVQDMVQWTRTQEAYDPNRKHLGKFIAPDNVPAESHLAHYTYEQIMQCPHVMRIANDPAILGMMGDCLGCKPTISSINFWWSMGGRAKAEHAELFHRDVDDWRFFKLFIYLTDVDDGTGPHVFVKGSQNEDALLPIRRYEDDEVEKAFGKDRLMRITGPAGTAFLENTFGFHKGTLCKDKNRLAFQVQYSVLPIFAYPYKPVPKGDIKVNGFEMDPFINRLFVKQ
ncbi:MAG: hypothetical protein QOJ65_2123 [Fimbriimonadaceae bacterium]|jgi:hypothetical protein|nr:hypothetical protein [Fimbriimonadaceae bacterium]